MNIIGSAITGVSGFFLHPGYISAYPRTLSPHAFERAEPLLQVEVKEALRLQGESLVSSASGAGFQPGSMPSETVSPVLAFAGGPGFWVIMLLASSAIFLSTALSARFKRRDPGWYKLLVASAVSFAAAVAVLLLAMPQRRSFNMPSHDRATEKPLGKEVFSKKGFPRTPVGRRSKGLKCIEPAPWIGVERREYCDPEAATKVILHGLLKPALLNARFEVERLSEIRYGIGFPNLDLSEWQKYALTTFGLDGWGREFTISRESENAMTVKSDGPDGVGGTKDDVAMKILGEREYFDFPVLSFYITRDPGGELSVFHHASNNSKFVYRNRAAAIRTTGSDMFDIAQDGQPKPPEAHFHSSWPMDLAATVFNEVAADRKYAPLVLRVVG